MNYNSLMNKPTINYRELIGDNTVSEVGGITEKQFNTLLSTDLTSYYTKAQIDDLFSRSYVYREKSGNIVTFDCPASVNGIDKVVSKIVAVQDLHGYDYPWVGGAGRNLFNMGSKVNTTASSMTVTSDDNYITFNGEKYGQNALVFSALAFTLPAGTYYAKTFNISGTSTIPATVFVYKNGSSITNNILGVERSFTLDEESTINIDFHFGADKTTYINYKLGIVISKTAKIDKYYPYSNICPFSGWSAVNLVVSPTTDAADGTTYTTTLKDGQGNPMTYYGGQLTNENGVQRLDNGKDIRLVSECTWQGSNGAFYTNSVASSIKHGDGRFDHVMSSAYKTENVGSITTLSDGAISVDADGYIQIKDSRYSTAGDFKSNMGTTQLVYELATPQQIPQDSLSIATQEGTNNIWADTGDITVNALDKIIQG